MKKCAT